MQGPQSDPYRTIGPPSSLFDEPAIELAPGMVLGNKYELLEQIGRGGMGVVWKTHDRVGDRLVACKFVPRDLQRFESEMQRVRETFGKVHMLNHQSICPLYGLEDGGPQIGHYLVMKYLEGETLSEFITRVDHERKGLQLSKKLISMLSLVAWALDHAHHCGVIHRDIKPSNIFLLKTSKGIEVQVIDFGLADEIKSSLTRVTQSTLHISGTRPYMAPEQWRGRRQTAATDQYALGVVVYELLTGELPFQGSDTEMLRLAVMQDPPEIIQNIPVAANTAIQKAMAKDAVDRFESCVAFVKALGYTSVAVSVEKQEKREKQKKTSHQGYCSNDIRIIDRSEMSSLPPQRVEEKPSIVINESLVKETVSHPTSDTHGNSETMQETEYGAQFNSLHDAAKRGNIDDVKYYTEMKGLSVNTENRNKETALHYAAGYNSNVDVIKYLVENGADINAKNKNDWSPLHCAAEHNFNIEILKYLIFQLADVNAKNKRGKTPLDLANTEKKRAILIGAGGKSGQLQTPLAENETREGDEEKTDKTTGIEANNAGIGYWKIICGWLGAIFAGGSFTFLCAPRGAFAYLFSSYDTLHYNYFVNNPYFHNPNLYRSNYATLFIIGLISCVILGYVLGSKFGAVIGKRRNK